MEIMHGQDEAARMLLAEGTLGLDIHNLEELFHGADKPVTVSGVPTTQEVHKLIFAIEAELKASE